MIALGIAATVIFTACLEHPTINPALATPAPASDQDARVGAAPEKLPGSAPTSFPCKPSPNAVARARNSASDASSEKN